MKKRLLLIPLAVGLMLTSCNSTSNNNNNSSNTGDNTTESGEDTTITPSVKEDTYKDGDYSYNYISDYESFIDDSVTTTLANASLPSSYTLLEEGEVSITEAGDYLLEGNYETITLALKEAGSVHLFFKGVTISDVKKALVSDDSDLTTYLIITILEDSEITTTKNSFDLSTTLFINGSGTLKVTSQEKSAIKTSKNVFIKDTILTLATLTMEEGHGVSAESIYAKDATINVTTAGKDGLHAEIDDVGLTTYVNSSGYVYLSNVNYTYLGYGDAIQADSFLYINEGNYNVTTTPHFVAYGSTEASEYEITDSDDFKYKKSGDTYYKVASENRGKSGTYALVNSVKGFKVGEIDQEDSDGTSIDIDSELYLTYIKGGTFIFNTADDSIHTNQGSNIIEKSIMTFDTLDQAIQSDGPTTITNSNIVINSSYEGIEGSSIHLNGEDNDVSIISSDDGMNAASDYYETDKDFYRLVMNINAGKLKVVAGGDGLDSNGAIYFNGGTSYVEGSSQGGDSPLDSAESNENTEDHGIYMNGGNVMATGTNGMLESPQTSSSQYSIVYTSSTTFTKGDAINVTDSDNNIIFTTTITNSGNSIILSSSSFVNGGKYTIYLNGTALETITISSKVTTSGTSQDGNNQPGGNNPGQGGNQGGPGQGGQGGPGNN